MGSTRASAWSCGTESARWIRRSGAIANGTSHGFAVQNAASTTPSAAKTNSVDSVWYEKTWRIGCPLTQRIIGATSEELSATSTTEAAVPASAKRTSSLGIRPSAPMITCALPHAAIAAIVNTQMLNDCTYQVPRLRSHSGTCWISGMNATSPGGRSSTAAIRKTPVVWYDLFPGVRTTKNCASATLVARIANSIQLPVCRSIWVRNGVATVTAPATTQRK